MWIKHQSNIFYAYCTCLMCGENKWWKENSDPLKTIWKNNVIKKGECDANSESGNGKENQDKDYRMYRTVPFTRD